MRVGLQVCTYTWPGGAGAIAPTLAAIAQNAEAAGFYSFWLMDHFQQIPGWGSREADPMLEAYTALGYVAARTTTLRLGTLASAAPYRPASVLIKAAITLDVLAGGRGYLGIGAGWFEAEATALGLPLPTEKRERFALLEDTVRLARQSRSGDASAFEGARMRAAAPVQVPRPLGTLPILIAGRGRHRTIGLVAKYADAWNVIASPKEAPGFLRLLRERCRKVGRRVEEIEITVLDPEDWRKDEVPAYRWTPEWELARLRHWRDLGIEHVIVNMSDTHDPAKVAQYREVIAAVSA